MVGHVSPRVWFLFNVEVMSYLLHEASWQWRLSRILDNFEDYAILRVYIATDCHWFGNQWWCNFFCLFLGRSWRSSRWTNPHLQHIITLSVRTMFGAFLFCVAPFVNEDYFFGLFFFLHLVDRKLESRESRESRESFQMVLCERGVSSICEIRQRRWRWIRQRRWRWRWIRRRRCAHRYDEVVACI